MPLTKSVNQGYQAVSTSTEQSIASASSSLSATAASGKEKTSAKVASGETVAADEKRVCWLEVKRCPYQPDHQVELLHLQAEADALLIKLQATTGKQ